MTTKVSVFVADECKPCAPIKEADLENGDISIQGSEVAGVNEDVDIKLVDVTSDEGFPAIEKYSLEAVPSAVIEDDSGRFEVCKILVDEQTKKVTLLCGDAAKEAAPPEEPLS